jgi:hypothetical protein
VNAEQKMKDAKGAAKYIGRYLARPSIAEYRVVNYDGKTVHFWYEDHQTGKRVDEVLPVYKFLYNLIQHIQPKHFRMVGRFGLYSRRSYKKANYDLKENEEVEVVCPFCNGTMQHARKDPNE